MIPLLLSEIAVAAEGQLVGIDVYIESISTDSRSLKSGDVFLALKGPNFDGHKFVQQATELACKCVIVDHQMDDDIPQIIVEDTHKALGQIAAYVKGLVSPKTVAITGSSGKTTVKEMTAAILARLGHVLATQGNFNNDIGVPLTLLRLTHEHDFAVVELGANHIGEIAYTSSLVKPDVALINNVAAAHLEGFGDLSGVARAKGEIFAGLNDSGVALYNQDCSLAHIWQWRLQDRTVKYFSTQQVSDFYSSDITLDHNGYASFTLHTPVGSTQVNLMIPGEHNVTNALASSAIALEFGATLEDIALGLAAMTPVKGRMNLYQLNAQIKLIDDTYNANVDSIKAAIDLLSSYPGRRLLVLGDMGELGSEARTYHQEIGEYAKLKNINALYTLGVLSQSTYDAFQGEGGHFSDKTILIEQLMNQIEGENQTVSILVKGSRSAHMELVVDAIKEKQELIEKSAQGSR